MVYNENGFTTGARLQRVYNLQRFTIYNLQFTIYSIYNATLVNV
jgi:hypothetical protein